MYRTRGGQCCDSSCGDGACIVRTICGIIHFKHRLGVSTLCLDLSCATSHTATPACAQPQSRLPFCTCSHVRSVLHSVPRAKLMRALCFLVCAVHLFCIPDGRGQQDFCGTSRRDRQIKEHCRVSSLREPRPHHGQDVPVDHANTAQSRAEQSSARLALALASHNLGRWVDTPLTIFFDKIYSYRQLQT